jgi:UDP:flavonoid glycosyltransferase YjiC (YdhE family)
VSAEDPSADRRSIAAVFAMPETGHFQRLRHLVADLARHGIDPHVFTDRRFEAEVRRAGGTFVDLFAAYPLEAADRESVPVPCRYVSFAAVYADAIAADIERLAPALVIYDTFAVVGHVVGRLLGLPYVNVCAGHNVDPGRVVAQLEADPRVSISPACQRAVGTLRERYGLSDASPFSYVSGLSPFLNLYCEPPAFLGAAERRKFEPLAFYGSLPSLETIAAAESGADRSVFGPGTGPRVYVSFGTVVWRYWTAEAVEALRTISAALSDIPEARVLISLGGAAPGAGAIRALERPNVSVAGYVDQWQVLREADVFVTHQGLNSTHEAIFNRVPMLSYPFFWDQPALAETCRRLGLAIPLTNLPRGPLQEEKVRAALSELSRRGPASDAALAAARDQEIEVIANRDDVLRRVKDLIAA